MKISKETLRKTSHILVGALALVESLNPATVYAKTKEPMNSGSPIFFWGSLYCPETAKRVSTPVASFIFIDKPDISRSVLMRLEDTTTGESGYVVYATPPRNTDEPTAFIDSLYDEDAITTIEGEKLSLTDEKTYRAQI